MRRIHILICFFLTATIASSQNEDDVQPSLVSPYATIKTHLYFLQPDTYDPSRASITIPLSDPAEAEQVAIQLKQIFDGKGLYVQLNMIPQQGDYIDSTSMAHLFTPFPKQLPEVYLERTDSLWQYSNETIRHVDRLHRKLYPLGADLLSRRMPDALRSTFLGLALWQYLGILCLIAGAGVVHLILSRALRPIVSWITGKVRHQGYANPSDIRKAALLASLLLVLKGIAIVFPVLQLPIKMSRFTASGLEIISIVFWMLLALAISRIILSRIRAISSSTENRMDDQLMPILGKLFQIGIVVVAIVSILSSLDVNVTALIAGLSIGALALALAAQDTVKNLIGSLMIFIDRPFQVGDVIVAEGQEGTVVEVGFRSTRIRMIDTSIISIPNGTVANITISNLGVREFRMMNILLGVTYSTTPEQIENFISELKKLIQDHSQIHKENFLVHFREMGDSALKIMFRCYIPVNTFSEELKIREEIYLEIMRIAERLEISFAFPSTSIYMENEKTPDPPTE